MHRAASDSRASDVFASVFYLPKPRPLNYLINELWKGPTAVVQGVLDPLNDAKVRWSNAMVLILRAVVTCSYDLQVLTT